MFGPTTNAPKRQKHKVPVELELVDGSLLLGNLFVGANGRLSDEINDDRQFLPVELATGRIVHVSKETITRVTELRQPEATDGRTGTDPYSLLGVRPDASDADIKLAYTSLVRAYHPDRWANDDLPAEAVEALNASLARINDAYHRLMRERRQARQQDGDGA